MRKSVKIVIGVVGAIVLVVGGVFIAAMVSVVRDNLPADSPRVLETDDFRFEAPERWVTTCADRAPGCLAVLATNMQWKDREYWIEAEQVADDVADSAFVDTAFASAAAIAEADGGKRGDLTAKDGEFLLFEGTERIDFTHGTAARFSRSRFVLFPDHKLLRFTCYGEQRGSAEDHNASCVAALDNLHFPAAAAAEQQALEELAAQCAKDPWAPECEGTGSDDSTSSDPHNFFSMDNVRRLWSEAKKNSETLEKRLEAERAAAPR